jgi:hypothetical protein
MKRSHRPMGVLAIALAALLPPAAASAQKGLRYTDHEPLGCVVGFW